MTVWKPMKDAPYSGARVLLKCRVKFDRARRRVHWEGTKVVEAWWTTSSFCERWHEWTGSAYVQSTETLDPIEWTEVPQ